MNYDVIFKVKADSKEGGECISRFWEAMGDLITKEWKNKMEGEITINNILIDGEA